MVEIWTLSAMVGALAAAYGIREAVADLAELRGVNELDAGRMRLIGAQRLFAQIIRCLILIGWAAIGVAAWASGAGESSPLTIVVLILILGNIGTAVLAVSDVIVSRLVREPYTDPIAEQEEL